MKIVDIYQHQQIIPLKLMSSLIALKRNNAEVRHSNIHLLSTLILTTASVSHTAVYLLTYILAISKACKSN